MRRNRSIRQGSQSGIFILVGILFLAVVTGYLGTRYLIAPYLLKSETPSKAASVSESGIISGEQKVQIVSEPAVKAQENQPDQEKQGEQTAPAKPESTSQSSAPAQTEAENSPAAATAAPASSGKYAVQFGSFSTEAAAQAEVSALAAQNIAASVFAKDGTYKVIGKAFDTKEQAKADAERLRAVFSDVFVTGI